MTMERMEIRGRCGTAIAYAKVIEEEAVEQIRRMCDYEFTEGASIRIMPDVHWGKGCTIGTTMTVRDKVVPNLVGVDIGCANDGVCHCTNGILRSWSVIVS
ncbi:MAG: RtcB family protein [Selenomonas massiliensis]